MACETFLLVPKQFSVSIPTPKVLRIGKNGSVKNRGKWAVGLYDLHN